MKNIFLSSIYVILAILFLHTASSKFLDFSGFIYDLNNQPFPNSWTPFLVWAIPLTEIAIVITFFFQKTRLAGLYASLALMSVFTIYSALVMSHVFAYVPCSCGGFIKLLSWPQHLMFTLLVSALCVWGIRLSRGQGQQVQPTTNKRIDKHILAGIKGEAENL
jgi:putative oxidoreductase